jgi:hypothetical protein
VADRLLRKVSKEMGVWDGPAGVERGLMAEIHRLTNVLMPGRGGWETVPIHEAKERGFLDSSEASEVDACIVFFTLMSVMHKKTDLKEVLDGAMSLWGAQIELLNCTEYTNFLKTSTTAASSGATVAA